ncbi:MAG: hypothetical protein AB9917_13640 [Negativicutes bacterium]
MFTIGTVVALDDPSSFKETPDDRIENVPCIDDTYLEDLGLNAAGTTYDVTLTITDTGYAALLAYRAAKTKPAITDHRGNSLGNRAFKIKGSTYVDGCALRQVELEILRG